MRVNPQGNLDRSKGEGRAKTVFFLTTRTKGVVLGWAIAAIESKGIVTLFRVQHFKKIYSYFLLTYSKAGTFLMDPIQELSNSALLPGTDGAWDTILKTTTNNVVSKKYTEVQLIAMPTNHT